MQWTRSHDRRQEDGRKSTKYKNKETTPTQKKSFGMLKFFLIG